MFEQIQQSVATAARRRIYFKVYDSADAVSGKVFTTTGVKVYLSKNGAAAALSTQDIVAEDATNKPGAHYIELTTTEADTIGQVTVDLPAATGRLQARAQATIVAFDPYADGASASSIATASAAAILATPANKLVTASDGSVQLSAADEANIASVASKVDATVSSRASAASLAAGVTLTSGERTATVAALLATIVETNGGSTMTVKQALQIAAAGVVGKRGGIVAGTGTQTITLRSAMDGQVLGTITGDDLGNTTNVVVTTP